MYSSLIPIEQRIIENIVYMLSHDSIFECNIINNYTQPQLRHYNNYKQTIYPKLSSLIQNKNAEYNVKVRNNQYDKLQGQYSKNDLKIKTYQSIIAQFNPFQHTLQRQANIRFYNNNQHILDSRFREYIEEALQIQRFMQQYQQLKYKMIQLRIFCNKYHKQNRQLNVLQTVDELSKILKNNQLVNKKQQMQLSQIDSIQLFMGSLLDILKTKHFQFQINTYLHEVKSNNLRLKMQQMIDQLKKQADLKDSIQKLAYKCKLYGNTINFQCIMDEIGKYIDILNSRSISQKLQQAIKVIISPVYKYVFDKECTDIVQEIIQNSQKIIKQFDYKIANTKKIKEQYNEMKTSINTFFYFINGDNISHSLTNQILKQKLENVRAVFFKNNKDRMELSQEKQSLKKQKEQSLIVKNQLLQRLNVIQGEASRYKKEKEVLLSNISILQSKIFDFQKKLQQSRKIQKDNQLSSKNSMQLSNLQQQYKIQKLARNNLQINIDQLKISIEEKVDLISSLNKQNQLLRQKIAVLQRQKKDAIFQNQGKLKSITDDFEDEKLQLIKNFQQKLTRQTERIKKQSNIQRNKQLDKIRGQKLKLLKEYDEIFSELQEYKEKYYAQIGKKLCMSFDLTNSRLSDKAVGQSFIIDETENEKNNLQLNIEQVSQEIYSEENIQQLKNQYKKQFEEDIQKLKKEIILLKQQIQFKDVEVKTHRQQGEILKDTIEKNKSRISQMDQKIIELEKQLNKSKQNIKLLNQTNKSYGVSLNSFTKAKNPIRSYSDILHPHVVPFSYILFNRKVFDNRQEQKQVLIKHIQSYTRAEIIKTQLLFQYNEKNKVNFHPYIDNKKYFVCVVRTSKVIVAGFYPGQICEKKIMNEGGLLISITKDKSFKLQYKKQGGKITNYRAMTYDPYYIVFGNAELRIKTGEKMLFSNYGMTTGYYDYSEAPKKVEYFLQEGDEREVQILQYQCYQIFFDRSLPFNQGQIHQENIFRTA